MHFAVRYANRLALVGLASSVLACTPIPIYQPPGDNVDRGHIRIDFQDQSILAGVAILYNVQGPILCGEAMNVERMIRISKRSALVTDENPTGVYVPSGKRMTLSFIGLNDMLPACGRSFSFIPEAGKSYSLRVANNADPRPYSASQPCDIDLLQYKSSGQTDGAATTVPSFQLEACVQK